MRLRPGDDASRVRRELGSEDDALAPVDPRIVLLIWWMNQGIIRLVLFDEILDGLDGPRGLPSFHIGLVGQIFYL